jgi:hypothetical protein
MVDYKFANDIKVVMDGYKFALHENISWKELLSRTKQLKELPSMKTKLMCSIKSLHSYLALPYVVLYDNQLDSRTDPFQEWEDDEDISTTNTTPTTNGPITRSKTNT